MEPDPRTGLDLADIADYFEVGDDPQDWGGYVRSVMARMELLETTLRALTLDDPIVDINPDDANCYVCGAQYERDHDDDCRWFVARAIFDLTTAGQTRRVPYPDDNDEDDTT